MRPMRAGATIAARRRTAVVAAMLATAAALGSCETAGQGAVSGGAVGALSGLAIGSITGHAGEGAAIGAIAGVVGGAIIGDQNRRKHEQAMAASTAPASSGTPAMSYDAAGALEKLVGRWDVQGWAQSADGERTPISGSATASADKNFFVRIELRLNHPRGGETIEGTSVLSQNGGRSVTMVNSFSTSPEVKRFEGDLDSSGSIFSLRQVSPNGNRRIVIRQAGPGTWTFECWEPSLGGGEQRTESLTFTAAR